MYVANRLCILLQFRNIINIIQINIIKNIKKNNNIKKRTNNIAYQKTKTNS